MTAQRLLIVLVWIAAVCAIAAISAPGSTARGEVTPKIRCDHQHPGECHRAIAYWRGKARAAQRAAQWQKRSAMHEVTRALAEARGAVPFSYAAKLAHAACETFTSGCAPPGEMLAIGRCESGLQNHDPNPSSTADGWMQFLSGTWDRSTAGQLGFSRYDPLAMAIAAEGIRQRDGSWREWVCRA